jgi:hypothetical protein
MLKPLNAEYKSKRCDRKDACPETKIPRPYVRIVDDLEGKLNRDCYSYCYNDSLLTVCQLVQFCAIA